MAEFFTKVDPYALWDENCIAVKKARKHSSSLKIKHATFISQVTTGDPAIEDTPVIGFQKKDLIGLDVSHNDAFIICIQIEQAVIERVHMDKGSAANTLQLSVILQMRLVPKINKLVRSLIDFNGAMSITVGMINLGIH
ncbi:unnamed protein product [Prunus brigantina]